MASMTTYLREQLANALLRGVAYTLPATYEFALFTSAPSAAGGGTEVSGGSYDRVPIATSAANFTDPALSTGGVVSNNVDITFPAISAVVSHVGVFDAHTAGHLLWWSALKAGKAFDVAGAAPKFAIGSITFKMDA